MKEVMQEQFWITNISKQDVGLGDLNLSIPSFKSINLLDKKHYHLTKEQLIASASSGSLFRKRNKIIIREVAPSTPAKSHVLIQENAIFPTKQRSAIELENIKYEELNVSDEDFATEGADTAQTDHLGKWKR